MITREDTATLFDDMATEERNDSRDRTVINRSLSVVDQAGVRVVFFWQEPLYRFAHTDTLTLRFVAVHLRLSGLARQEEVSRAFGHSVATQRRWETRYQKQGLAGLEDGKSSGRPRGVPDTCDLLLRNWFAQGTSHAEMSRRLAVSEAAIQRALARLRLRRRPAVSAELPRPDDSGSSPSTDSHQGSDLPPGSAESEALADSGPVVEAVRLCTDAEISAEASCGSSCDEEAAVAVATEESEAVGVSPRESLADALARLTEKGFTIDRDPDDRTGDRALARLGQLDDALPLLGDRLRSRPGS